MKHTIFLINIPENCGFGGCERNLIDYFSRIDYSAHKVTIIATKDMFSAKLNELKLPVEVKEFPFKIEGCFWGRFGRMCGFLKKLKPNSIVFVHNGFFQFTVACFSVAFLLTRGNVFSVEVMGAPKPMDKIKKKYFRIIPSLNLWWYTEMLPTVIRGFFSKRILAASREVRKRMIKWYYYPAHKIVVEYHGADVGRFYPDRGVKKSMRQDMGIAESDIVVIAVARFDMQKRIDRLIDGFKLACGEENNAWLVLIGDGPLHDELQEIVNKHDINKRVKFMGYQEDTAPYLQMSDIYVLSSDNEGFARVILESMAAGLVVIATDVTGIDEIIEDEQNGILVEASVEGIKNGLTKVFKMTENERNAVALNARQTILDNFELKKQADKELKVLGINGSVR